MSKHSHARNAIRKRGSLLPFIIFHRWAGLSAFILLLTLAITGIMLNHTEGLDLHKTYIKSQQIQQWYGIKMPQQQNFIQLENIQLAQVGKQLYFNQIRLPDEDSALLGAYKANDYIVISTRNSLYLITFEGDLIEKLDKDKSLPTPISQIGFSSLNNTSRQLMIEVENHYYTSHDDFLSWTEVQNKEFYPLKPDSADNMDKSFYQNAYLGNELTLERVILDLHSGRLLGQYGIYLMDLAAMILIMLGMSGTWIWSRRFRKLH